MLINREKLTDENTDISKKLADTLPRMGFEMSSMTFDAGRNINKKHHHRNIDGNHSNNLPAGSPWNFTFQLYIAAENQDDALQIVEQIVPYFKPDFKFSLVNTQLKNKDGTFTETDVALTLEAIDHEDSYEGEFDDVREVIYTLTFTAPYIIYGPSPHDYGHAQSCCDVNFNGIETFRTPIIKTILIDLHSTQATFYDPDLGEGDVTLTITALPATALSHDDVTKYVVDKEDTNR